MGRGGHSGELKDIQPPESMKRAMARQAEAEREKRAKPSWSGSGRQSFRWVGFLCRPDERKLDVSPRTSADAGRTEEQPDATELVPCASLRRFW